MRLFRRRPKFPTLVWRHGQPRPALPPGWEWAKPPKSPSGWVNLHVRREALEALGETSVKRGLAPAAIVNALFEMFAAWTEEEKRAFVWQYLLAGVGPSEGPIEDAYLPSDNSREEPEVKPQLEQLEARDCPAVTASFNAGVLVVVGDANANEIRVADRDNNNLLEVYSGGEQVAITGPHTPDRTATSLIYISGLGGNDSLIVESSVNTLDAAGVLARSPDVQLIGGDGDDFLQQQAGGIVGGLNGVVGGVVVGPVVGNAYYDGGNGNDTLISGFGNDVILGGRGNDLYVWPPGTLTDRVDLGSGTDTANIIGNNGAGDSFNLFVNGAGELVFTRDNLVNFTVFLTDPEVVGLFPGSGDDTVKVGKLNGTGVKVVNIDGGAGADDIQVARQKNAAIRVVADPLDVVNLDAVFAEMGSGNSGKGRR